MYKKVIQASGVPSLSVLLVAAMSAFSVVCSEEEAQAKEYVSNAPSMHRFNPTV